MAAVPQQRTVRVTRMFDVPPERVFAAWTQAQHLAHWFGPRGYTIHSCEADARPGGVFRLCMRSPQGAEYWVRGEYREVAAPARLVIACRADDERGVAQLEETIRVRFEAQGGGTRMLLEAEASGASARAAEMLKGMEQGWAQTIDRLASRFTE